MFYIFICLFIYVQGAFDFSAKQKLSVTQKEAKEWKVPFDFYYTDEVYQGKVEEMLCVKESIGWERRAFKQEAVLNQIKHAFYQSFQK